MHVVLSLFFVSLIYVQVCLLFSFDLETFPFLRAAKKKYAT